MISNYNKWKKFENNYKKKEKMSIKKKFKILDSLYKEALELKVFKEKNPLSGIEVKIRIAKVINSVSAAP